MVESSVETEGGLTLPAVADLHYAGPLKGELARRLETSADVCIDASAVQRIASPCLQVLLAARAFGSAEGKDFTIGPMSAAFEEAVSLLGLRKELGLQEG